VKVIFFTQSRQIAGRDAISGNQGAPLTIGVLGTTYRAISRFGAVAERDPAGPW